MTRHLLKYLQLFYAEVVTWAYLKNAHLLPLLGVVLFRKQRNYSNLVSPWIYEGKTLERFVLPGEFSTYESQCHRIVRMLLGCHLNLHSQCPKMTGVAEGLAYLHSHQIAHGDINDVRCPSSLPLQVLKNLRQTSSWMNMAHLSSPTQVQFLCLTCPLHRPFRVFYGWHRSDWLHISEDRGRRPGPWTSTHTVESALW